MNISRAGVFSVLAFAWAVGAATLCVTVQAVELPIRFTAVAVDLDRGLSTPIRITVERWSSPEVQNRLLKTLMTEGDRKLLEQLREAPRVGSIGTPTSLAWDLHFAQQTPGEDGGTRIVLATDRPIAFSEQWNGSRTLDYPFTVIELHVNDAGEGDGTMSFATKVIPLPSSNTVVLENWGTQRIRLTQVKPERR
jgi:hypothetical protein